MISRIIRSKLFFLFASLFIIGFLAGYDYAVISAKHVNANYANRMDAGSSIKLDPVDFKEDGSSTAGNDYREDIQQGTREDEQDGVQDSEPNIDSIDVEQDVQGNVAGDIQWSMPENMQDTDGQGDMEENGLINLIPDEYLREEDN